MEKCRIFDIELEFLNNMYLYLFDNIWYNRISREYL